MAKKRTSFSERTIPKDTIEEKKEENLHEQSPLLSEQFIDRIVELPINLITANPDQPRKNITPSSINDLTESIKAHGLLQPIVVRPHGDGYQVIAGERRYLACKKAGLTRIQALVKQKDDEQTTVLALVENIQREDLNDIDKAVALRDLKKRTNRSWDDIAKEVGISKRLVFFLIALLDLPEQMKEAIRKKKLYEKHGRALRKLQKDPARQQELFELLLKQKPSGDDSIKIATEMLKPKEPISATEAYAAIFKEKPQQAQNQIEKKDYIALTQSKVSSLRKFLDRLPIKELDKSEKKGLSRELDSLSNYLESIRKKL